MRIIDRNVWTWIAALALICVPSLGSADEITFSIAPWNTSPLQSGGGPYALAFQLTDGSGTGDGNTTVTINNFNLGTGGSPGAALGPPFTFGNAAGNLSSSVVLTDSDPSGFNELAQRFTPGDKLSFTVTIDWTGYDSPAPDSFSMLILQGNSNDPMPTKDPNDSAFVLVDVTGDSASPQFFGSDGGSPILNAPQLVPEPATISLLCVGLVGAGLVRLRRKNQAA
jgi:hypothetical protein